MAKGNFGSNGDGTEDKPFEVEDLWDYMKMGEKTQEVCDASKEPADSGSAKITNVYFKLTKDIDMNDYDNFKFELTKSIGDFSNISYNIHLNGDNHSLKNIIMKDSEKRIFYCYTGYGGQYLYGSLKKLKIENLCYINIESLDEGLISAATIREVHFGTFLFDSEMRGLMPLSNNISDCSYNIKGKIKDGSFLLALQYRWHSHPHQDINDKLKRVHFNFDCFIKNFSNNAFITGDEEFYNIFDNVYLTGKVKIYKSDYSSCFLFSNITTRNSYVNIDFYLPKNVTVISATTDSMNSPTYSFINEDRFKTFSVDETGRDQIDEDDIVTFVFTPANNLIFLTDEDCKDPNFLLSQGFPVVPSET